MLLTGFIILVLALFHVLSPALNLAACYGLDPRLHKVRTEDR
jgi:hypothetical protein